MFKTVLFPVDESRESRDCVEVVVNVVQKYGSRLLLLSVVETTEGQEASTELLHKVNAFLNKAKATLAEHDIAAETLLREGKPAFVICDVADELNVDLIIMGSRGLGLTDEAEDSVSTRVINLSPCPVLVVP
ncbi:universal stress protein [Leptolyngbya sp. FACHB-261]|uniref:universal stress protein n=1 Tax=Leptolyngbya sp. FACHB-261 TaxID=2692806 RepID=UPI001685E9D1|nr:universal stress protein [Leptolyngbya sp. FACHB-261]MBD2102172.1 universal stress protein [Leptolyngbya sp. FACHB-261]